MTPDPTAQQKPTPDEEMTKADQANGEGPVDTDDDAAANDTEARYGKDESPS